MPVASYHLCGFASGVDWRPIKFKECLPHARICDLCGFVPDKTAVLPCSHLLCESCLQGCADGDGACCPMDEEPFLLEGDVTWITHSQRHLSKMLVSCWNAENGCNFEGPAGNLLEHFEKECRFHATTCPRCQDTVLRRDLPQHYKEGCAAVPSSAACLGTLSAEHDSPIPGKLRSSYDDILSSLQGRTNELVESVNLISRRLVDIDEPLEPVSVEKQLRTVSQSLQTFLERAQEASAYILVAAGTTENSLSGTSQKVTINDPGEEHVLLTLRLGHFSEKYRRVSEEAHFTLEIEGERTNVEIQCLMSVIGKHVTVLAKLTEPGKWCLPNVEPLSTGEFCSPSLVSWAYESVGKPVGGGKHAIKPRFIPRCICKLPVDVPVQGFSQEAVLHFLIRMKRCSISKA